jgi:hypothetical protein
MKGHAGFSNQGGAFHFGSSIRVKPREAAGYLSASKRKVRSDRLQYAGVVKRTSQLRTSKSEKDRARHAKMKTRTGSEKRLKKNLGVNAGLTLNRHDLRNLQKEGRADMVESKRGKRILRTGAARRATLPDDTRRAPATPPAQPVGMAESEMNKSSWQKPARTGPARGSCGVRSRVAGREPAGQDAAMNFLFSSVSANAVLSINGRPIKIGKQPTLCLG